MLTLLTANVFVTLALPCLVTVFVELALLLVKLVEAMENVAHAKQMHSSIQTKNVPVMLDTIWMQMEIVKVAMRTV